MAVSGSILGNSVRRVEDPRILLGLAEYVDDIEVEGVLHLVFVRSTVAHARIDSIDTSEAKAMPGVVDVVTAEDLGQGPFQAFMMIPETMSRPPLAADTVRFVGDCVVAVVAETRAQAVDAAEMVIVEYDPLPVVIDPEAALADGATLLFPDAGTNVAVSVDFGEDPTVLDGAEVVVSGRFVNQRVAPVPMEGNGICVVPDDETGGLTVWLSTQGPFASRDPIATACGLAPEQVRVIAPTVGGGFGAKMPCYTEFVVAAVLAHRLRRPLKWVETRSENLVAMLHGRGQVQHVELGLERDGTIVGLRAKVIADGGAYPGVGSFLPFLTRQMAQGPYVIPKIQCTCFTAVTNTSPIGAFRGAGRPEATAMLERIIDMAADELGIDPVEIRRKNFIASDAFPYTTVTGAEYDVGDYVKALDEAVRIAGYDELRAEQQARRDRGDVVQLGIGVSAYVEVTAAGLSKEFASVEINDDGTVCVVVGTSAHGQGHETSFAMIVADLLGVPMEAVTLVQSDTALVAHGSGTGGSRSLQIGGSAILKAGEVVLDQAKELAAHLLEADVEDIVVHAEARPGGGLGVSGVPARALSWSELARAARDESRRPAGMQAALSHALDFDQGAGSYPFGAHIAVVEVDTETGRTQLMRHIAVDDCGRILNPMLVTGQQHGGIAQGVSQVLWEGVVYDEDGNPLTSNLMDYPMPSAAEFPSFETANTVTETHLNPLGAKGIGESGTIGSMPAVHNAVIDALSHFGIRHLDMPLSAEKVWRAIDAQRAGSAR